MVVRSSSHPIRRSSFLVFVTLLFSFLLAPAATRAATITVTSNIQEQPFVINGNCTLGEAIQAANTDSAVDACPAGNGPDMIALAANTTYELIIHSDTFSGWTALPKITSDIAIQGNNTILFRNSNESFRLFAISSEGTLRLQNIVLSDGNIGVGFGGSLLNDGKLYLRQTVIQNSRAVYGAAIYSNGSLYIEDSLIHKNALAHESSDTAGGGLFNRGHATMNNTVFRDNYDVSSYGADGSAIANGGVITITNSVIQNNSSARSTIDNVGDLKIVSSTMSNNTSRRVAALNNSGDLQIDSSTISGNREGIVGGIINTGNLSIFNSTLSANSGSIVGAVYNGVYGEGGKVYTGNIVISHSTVSDNQVTANDIGLKAGALSNGSTNPITLTHTLLSNNRLSDGTPSDCAGQVVSRGYNLVEAPAGCDLITSTGDIIGVAALLGPLADNGGPTWTQLPQHSSPAIDAGDRLYAGPLVNDQRGADFPRILGGRIDIGAVEVGSAASTPTASVPTTTLPFSTPVVLSPTATIPTTSTPMTKPTDLPASNGCLRHCHFLPWIAIPAR